MALYERLIDDGLADADRQGGAVDHLTARRLAIWLNARPQQRDFAHALDQFIQTGAISRQLRAQLRERARFVNYAYRPQVSRLLQYSASRGPDLGPIGTGFAAACDQMDRADAMLSDLKERTRLGIRPANQASPEPGIPAVTAHASQDPANPAVTLTMDAATAGIAIFAIAANASEREAYAREVSQFGQGLPEGSYGRQNRQSIAARETRAAKRLRAIERAYQIALAHAGATPDPADTRSEAERAADRDREMELE
jgi:hypothetical protein